MAIKKVLVIQTVDGETHEFYDSSNEEIMMLIGVIEAHRPVIYKDDMGETVFVPYHMIAGYRIEEEESEEPTPVVEDDFCKADEEVWGEINFNDWLETDVFNTSNLLQGILLTQTKLMVYAHAGNERDQIVQIDGVCADNTICATLTDGKQMQIIKKIDPETGDPFWAFIVDGGEEAPIEAMVVNTEKVFAVWAKNIGEETTEYETISAVKVESGEQPVFNNTGGYTSYAELYPVETSEAIPADGKFAAITENTLYAVYK